MLVGFMGEVVRISVGSTSGSENTFSMRLVFFSLAILNYLALRYCWKKVSTKPKLKDFISLGKKLLQRHSSFTLFIATILILLHFIAVSIERKYLTAVTTKFGLNRLVLADGGFWKFVTSPLFHFNWNHLLINLFCLMGFGILADYFFGRKNYLFIIIAAAICGVFASLLEPPILFALGFSGVLWGLFGALLVDRFFRRTTENSLRPAYDVFLFLTAVGVVQSSFDRTVDGLYVSHMAHYGGLVGGACAAIFILRTKLKATHFLSLFGLALVCLVFLSIGYQNSDLYQRDALLRTEYERYINLDIYLESDFFPFIEKQIQSQSSDTITVSDSSLKSAQDLWDQLQNVKHAAPVKDSEVTNYFSSLEKVLDLLDSSHRKKEPIQRSQLWLQLKEVLEFRKQMADHYKIFNEIRHDGLRDRLDQKVLSL
jgi:membrane associated rhomboid family serine protease